MRVNVENSSPKINEEAAETKAVGVLLYCSPAPNEPR